MWRKPDNHGAGGPQWLKPHLFVDAEDTAESRAASRIVLSRD